MFRKVLVANRGEIAVRILRTLKRLGVASVAVHSDADAFARHVRDADESAPLGGALPKESYLRIDKVIEAARQTGAEAIHPGYGFLSESAEFAEACAAVGICFVGPTPAQIREFGLKHRARDIAAAQHVPLLPGTPLLASAEDAARAATQLGYPVMLKSTAGGGGIGLRVCRREGELASAFEAVERLGRSNFGQAGAFLERYVERARHIEVQIFGDGLGRVDALGERDCSVQRRNQKVIEETPAPGISDETRARLFEAAERMGRAVAYASAGTVEFLVDADTSDFYFLEVNTRLQVEHGVTEAVLGIDLVEWMLRQAAGDPLPSSRPRSRGAAIEVRLYAEDPAKDYQPSTGLLTDVVFDPSSRVDTWVESGIEITPFYDPLLAKIIAYGDDREAARASLVASLAGTRIAGVETNREQLIEVLSFDPYTRGEVTTALLSQLGYHPTGIEVLDGGTQTTVQDPGRLGLWEVGVPPSGPMDDLAFHLANRLVGNDEACAALELTISGPTLKFRRDAVIALTGAPMDATIDDRPVAYFRAIRVRAGDVLVVGATKGAGCRAYLAVRGGIDVPPYLGSRATFMLGRFGGHGGRALRAGDVLAVGTTPELGDTRLHELDPRWMPPYEEIWRIGILEGPHAAPDFFTDDDIRALYEATWQVHYNSDRTGVRLLGPKPQWARRDGGEAGLHPSNLHDNAYAVGTVDYTGDMPVILGPDGPSLGGFVCPVTIVRAERWKMGQLKAGDRVRFHKLTPMGAEALWTARQAALSSIPSASPTAPEKQPPLPPYLEPPPSHSGVPLQNEPTDAAILAHDEGSSPMSRVVYRRSGDDYLLIEYGPPVLDLELRLRAHALHTALLERKLPGIVDLTPGIRSLQVHYNPTVLPTGRLLSFLRSLAQDLPAPDDLVLPSRTVHLPLSWEDPATLLAIEKYMRSVRPDAPWCPSNIEFIRRINGLGSVNDVREIVFNASYLVFGLGDVYLGAPVATPLDPRHRLVTTKYNPARTWTPENAVGIGGAYLCIYGMEGPGGYQFVGRTLQVWNTHRETPPFRDGKRHLLRFFDQIRFYPVSADELTRMREGFLFGRVPLHIEEETLSYRSYRQWIADNATSIGEFKGRQQAAFDAERERWRLAGQDVVAGDHMAEPERPVIVSIPEGCTAVKSPVAGSIWKVVAEPGARVSAGDPLVIVEAMKMEITVPAARAGRIREVTVTPGAAVAPGQVLAIVEPAE